MSNQRGEGIASELCQSTLENWQSEFLRLFAFVGADEHARHDNDPCQPYLTSADVSRSRRVRPISDKRDDHVGGGVIVGGRHVHHERVEGEHKRFTDVSLTSQ
jgi:hypothetical protein